MTFPATHAGRVDRLHLVKPTHKNARPRRRSVKASTPPKHAACKMCGQARDLADSHIVPEFMYNTMRPRRNAKLISLIEEEGFSPIATKTQRALRERLLCAECEGFINDHYERPLVETWKSLQNLTPSGEFKYAPDANGKVLGVTIRMNREQFKLLLLSIVWRASVAQRPEFSSVSLGAKHEPRVLKMLRNVNPGSPYDYPMTLVIFQHPAPVALPITPRRIRGATIYQLIIGRVNAWITVSSDRAILRRIADNSWLDDGRVFAPVLPVQDHGAWSEIERCLRIIRQQQLK